MTEIEQLRKEVNELRERLAHLEYILRPIGPSPGVSTQPLFVQLTPSNPLQPPPYVVTCDTTSPGHVQPKPDPGQVW